MQGRVGSIRLGLSGWVYLVGSINHGVELGLLTTESGWVVKVLYFIATNFPVFLCDRFNVKLHSLSKMLFAICS